MPPVHQRPNPMTLKGLLASWSAALAALPLVLLASASGQGLGAMVAGAGWIGISVPWDRQTWALVNQPVLNFSSLPVASGYWLGSSIAALLIAVLAITLSLRLGSLGAQLFVVQWSFMASVIGLAWQPALDPELGHVARWLHFRGLPLELRWVVAGVAAAVAVPAVLRLISIARITSYYLSRSRRLALVALHLLPAPLIWVAGSIVIKGIVPVEACIIAGIPLLVVPVVAWIGYPMGLTHAVAAVGSWLPIRLAAIAVVLWAVCWSAGRPLPEDRSAAFLWAHSTSTNNIRPWMEPQRAPWLVE